MQQRRQRVLVVGRIVHFVDDDDHGNTYCVPAIVTATAGSISNVDLNDITEYKLEKSSQQEVHLTVFSPDPLLENEGIYQEHGVPHNKAMTLGTYHWADECTEDW